MRRNFAQVLKEAKIDIKFEYSTLYDLFYSEEIHLGFGHFISIRDAIDKDFAGIWFRGTCISIDDFDRKYEYNFVPQPKEFNIEYLVSFCEYLYNLSLAYRCTEPSMTSHGAIERISFLMNQIEKVIDNIGYMHAKEDDFTIFVEKSPAAIAVSEILPKEDAHKVISYNHHSMRGDIEEKRKVLVQLATSLEGKREQLKKINKDLENDIFFLFNNINIRHNNCDESSTKYKQFVADMDAKSIEEWYDRTYQMCLTSFLELERWEEKEELDQLKINVGK